MSASTFTRELPWSSAPPKDRPKQIWGGHDGIVHMEIRQGATIIGKLVITGSQPPNGVPANTDAWYWDGTPWPSTFQLSVTEDTSLPQVQPEVLARVVFTGTSATHSTPLPHQQWTCTRIHAGVGSTVATLVRFGDGTQFWASGVAGAAIEIVGSDVLALTSVTPTAQVTGRGTVEA